jgi:hypothetical protein
MYARSVKYWQKLEALTGTSTAAERHETMARQAMNQSGFAGGRA